jgi:signal transduction histidine kinase
VKQKTLPYFIIGSLILLAIVEAIWLRREFENERNELRNNLFQSLRTAMSEENSFQIFQNLRKNPALDSLIKQRKITFSPAVTAAQIQATPIPQRPIEKKSIPLRRDTLINISENSGFNIRIDLDKRDSSLPSQPMIIALADTNLRHSSTLKFKVVEKDAIGGREKVRYYREDSANLREFNLMSLIANDSFHPFINEDSARLERLKRRLKEDFEQRLGLFLPFDVQILKREENVSPQRSAVVATIPWRIPLRDQKVAVAMYDFEGYLVRKIVAQILLGVFVLAAIGFSFWLVYRSFRQQKQLTELKNDLISNITHELKTPIATVSVALEALQNFDALNNPKLTADYLDISRHELSRLSMLVDKVLKLSVFEQKEPELNREPLNLAHLVQRVVDSMRLQFQKHNATVSLDLGDPSVATLEADPTHLTSVVYNLLDNALKYGGKQIAIEIAPLSKNLQLSVKDNGKGIAAEFQDKIFDKFFRVPTGDVHNTKGHGLGLSYVQSVIELHGGTIAVESTEGEGSTFTVTLPKD